MQRCSRATPYWIEMRIVPLRDRRGVISHFAAIERRVEVAAGTA